jgi:alkaline phosphatase
MNRPAEPCRRRPNPLRALALIGLALAMHAAGAAPTVSRLTPPSELFASNNAAPPYIARFLPGQRFDLQATVRLDAGATLAGFEFSIDGVPLKAAPAVTSIVTSGLSLPAGSNAAVVSQRAYSSSRPGVHLLSLRATQSDGQTVTARGNFEVVKITAGGGRKVKNVIILLGDGMGATHRTAARVIGRGYAQGKAQGRLAMDSFPVTGMVMTSSLDAIVTDSSPGMSNYVTGNKAANNQEGVWPDDTTDAFDNPRTEYLSEYLHRTQGTALGIVTTADVFDATPGSMAAHTSDRGLGSGIVDQFFDDRGLTGLAVLMGGGRKWFLPNTDELKPDGTRSGQPMNGSQRDGRSDYLLPADIVAGWGAAKGAKDASRDLIAEFQGAGFRYAPDKAGLDAAAGADKLLGLFAYSNMNVAFDKIGKRRGASTVVDEYGFPDQPMLDEMAAAALQVLAKNKRGFVALIEGASIDKQSHAMDTDRWLLEMLEFDRAVQVAKDFALKHPDTLVLVTADHECSGAAIIGASTRPVSAIQQATANPSTASLRDAVVGTYTASKFPKYTIAPDGYPQTTDVDHKMLIGYGANSDRYETWLANARPSRDSPALRNAGTGFFVTGQVPGDSAVHTATDVPLSAMGRGAAAFSGVMDNTDVFFRIGQAVLGGVR